MPAVELYCQQIKTPYGSVYVDVSKRDILYHVESCFMENAICEETLDIYEKEVFRVFEAHYENLCNLACGKPLLLKPVTVMDSKIVKKKNTIAEVSMVINKKEYFNENDDFNYVVGELTHIFGECLGIGSYDEKDNFFECGGNSLLLIRLIKKINEVFGRILDKQEILLYASPYELAKRILSNKEKDVATIQPFNKFWFIDCYFTSVLALLEYYHVDIIPFMRKFTIYDVELRGEYRLLYDNLIPYEEIFNELCFEFVKGKINNSDDFSNKILNCINNKVFFLHVDCYYLSYCKQKYRKEHFEHVITVIGYKRMEKNWL